VVWFRAKNDLKKRIDSVLYRIFIRKKVIESMVYDVIIIGAGPAGPTAAIYSSRARLTTG
jgi:alkyl hydroperoxide reductase subunit AhpF